MVVIVVNMTHQNSGRGSRAGMGMNLSLQKQVNLPVPIRHSFSEVGSLLLIIGYLNIFNPLKTQPCNIRIIRGKTGIQIDLLAITLGTPIMNHYMFCKRMLGLFLVLTMAPTIHGQNPQW